MQQTYRKTTHDSM